MFKKSNKSAITFNGDKKIEDKVSSDFVTHNMPEPTRFSGQTFSSQTTGTISKPIVAKVSNHYTAGLIIIIGGLILVGALLYFGYSYFIKPYVLNTKVTDNTKIVEETPATSSEKVETPVTVPETITISEPVISTSTNEIASSTEIILPEETPIISAPVTVSTIDSDADGLTDDEEKIVGTDPNKADTDNDGYLDLAEFKSGYDPLVPGKKTSETSAILNYQIDSKTTVIYPNTWEVTRSDLNQTVVFTDSDKAFIQAVYQDNSNKMSPILWFKEQFMGLTPGESVIGTSWQGFYSQDGLAAYIFNKDLSKVYSFSCSPLTSDTTSVTLFHLMIKTLIIK